MPLEPEHLGKSGNGDEPEEGEDDVCEDRLVIEEVQKNVSGQTRDRGEEVGYLGVDSEEEQEDTVSEEHEERKGNETALILDIVPHLEMELEAETHFPAEFLGGIELELDHPEYHGDPEQDDIEDDEHRNEAREHLCIVIVPEILDHLFRYGTKESPLFVSTIIQRHQGVDGEDGHDEDRPEEEEGKDPFGNT